MEVHGVQIGQQLHHIGDHGSCDAKGCEDMPRQQGQRQEQKGEDAVGHEHVDSAEQRVDESRGHQNDHPPDIDPRREPLGP